MDCDEIVFTRHALVQMFARSLSPDAVRTAVTSGRVVEDYPDDRPYPSKPLLAFVDGRAVHVVVAKDDSLSRCYVVTTYPPDPDRWEVDFTRRRR